MIMQRFDPSGEQYFRELPDRLARVVDRWLLELSQPYPIGIGELARKVGSRKGDSDRRQQHPLLLLQAR